MTTRIRAALWAVLAVGASVAAPLLGRPLDRGGESALLFAPKAFDFGTVRAGAVVHAEFTYMNPTDAPIRILDVHGTCGCVEAEVSSTFIEPGRGGKVKARVSTEGRMGRQNLGVRLRTDEGPHGGARLMLMGEIRVSLRPKPPRVVLGSVAPGSEHSVEIRIEKLEPVRAVSITPRGDGISAEALGEDGKGLDLRVTLKVPWSRPSQGTGVRLEGGEGVTWIPVLWEIPPPFELSAPEIEIAGGRGDIVARPRWPEVKLARIDTHGLPLSVEVKGERIGFALEGSPLDIPSGATIDLVPEPESLGSVRIPVYVRPE